MTQGIGGTSGPLSEVARAPKNDPEGIKKAAQEMEAMFLYELIKEMRSIAGAAPESGFGGETYTSLFDMELAKVMSRRGTGLQDAIIRGLDKESLNKVYHGGHNMPDVTLHEDGKKDDKEAGGILAPEARPRISSGFGLRHDPITGTVKFHHGVDIVAEEGAEIYPIKAGRVIFSGDMQGYGNVVIIDHGDGFITKYAHNRENFVKAGDEVDAATPVALVGSTGRATGPHIHFEVVSEDEKINPLPLISKRQG